MEALTIEQILKNWVYVGNTQANGRHYHDEQSDRSAVVYVRHTMVFSCRREGMKGNFPACYKSKNEIQGA